MKRLALVPVVASFLLFCPTVFAQAAQTETCHDAMGNVLVNCTPSQVQPQVQPSPQQRNPTKVKYGYGGEVGVPKVMGVVGYTYESSSKLTASISDLGSISTPTRGFNGGFIQPTFNLTDYIAVIGHVDAAYHSENVTLPDFVGSSSFPLKLTTLSYTAGPQVYPMGHHYAWQPFAHATFGAATLLMNKATEDVLGLTTNHETAFAYQIGGGLDYRSSSRLGWRVGQIDYIHAKKTISGVDFTYSAVKIGVGVSF